MTRRLNLILLLFSQAILLLIGCQKHISVAGIDETSMVRQAQLLVDSISTAGYPVNYRAAQPKTIRWDLAQGVAVNNSEGIMAPIVFDNLLLVKANYVGNQYFHLNYLSQVLFYRDTVGANRIAVITAFPDSNYFKDPTEPFTGIKFIEDWQGHLIQKLLFTSDGKSRSYVSQTKEPDALEVIQTCYSIVGYNYSPGLDEGYSWEEPAGCSVEYTDDGPGGGVGGEGGPGAGGGASSLNGASLATVLPGNSVIKSIKNYFQCFTNVGGSDHTYIVTVCVDQPDPGTRTPWTTSGSGASGSSGGGNPVDVGHTFLILTENTGNTTISRNVGFYPAGEVNPVSNTSQGTLNDDETHAYNISGSFTVNNAQFFNILTFISQGNGSGYLYNLNTNNCSTFVINAAAQGGISLPRTIGTWLGGAGNDPGDLGEDLRLNNIPGMVLNLAGGSDNSHYNSGQCN